MESWEKALTALAGGDLDSARAALQEGSGGARATFVEAMLLVRLGSEAEAAEALPRAAEACRGESLHLLALACACLLNDLRPDELTTSSLLLECAGYVSQRDDASDEAARARGSNLLMELPPDVLAELAEGFEVRSLAEGDALCREGDDDQAVFIICEGEVDVESSDGGLLGSLGAGTHVGEIAFLERRRRMASVIARRPTVVLALSAESLDARVLPLHPEVAQALHRSRDRRVVLTQLHSSPPFSEIQDETLRETLADASMALSMPSGRHVVSPGRAIRGILVIRTGTAEVLHDGVVVATLGAGDVIGTRAVLADGKASSEVRTTSDCQLVFFPGPAVLDVASKDASFRAALEALAERRRTPADGADEN